MKIAVIGAGSWGTALAGFLSAKGESVVLWTRSPEQAKAIRETRHNSKYLKDLALPDELAVTTSLQEAVQEAEILLLAVASQSIREVLQAMMPWCLAVADEIGLNNPDFPGDGWYYDQGGLKARSVVNGLKAAHAQRK